MTAAIYQLQDLAVNLVIGGVIGIFLQQLYRRFAGPISNRESFSLLFPLLIITTIIVFFVIKSAPLSLSLGLIGALSIVRFRAAIKEPEELIYLFFCIAMGLALGADLKWLSWAIACCGCLVFTVFVLANQLLRAGGGHYHLLLTICGKAEQLLPDNGSEINNILKQTLGNFTIQRLDVDMGQVQLRVLVQRKSCDIMPLTAKLQQCFPECQVSYVNLQNLL